MKAITIHLIMSLSFMLCDGQPAMSLNECIEYAFMHNPGMVHYWHERTKSMVLCRQARLDCLPSLYAEYNHYVSSGRSLNQELYEWENTDMQQGNMALTAELTLFQGLHNIYSHKSAASRYESSFYALENAKQKLEIKITRSYFEIIMATRSIKILELTHGNTIAELSSLHEQIDAGTVSKSSLYDLIAQSKMELLQLETLDADLDKHYLMLMKLMNWPSNIEFIVDSTLCKWDSSGTLDNLYVPVVNIETISGNSPEIKEKELQMEAVKYDIQMQKSQYFPVIRSVASISSRYMKNAVDPVLQSDHYEYIAQISDNQYKQLAISVSVPLFDRTCRNTDITLAKIEYEKLQNEKETAALELRSELLMIREEIESISEKIKLSHEVVQACKKSYETATEKFRVGLLNAYELNLAKNNYTGAWLELSKIRVQYSMNLALLKLYCSGSVL